MRGLELIRSEVLRCLSQAKLSACTAYGPPVAEAPKGGVIAVGLKWAESKQVSFSDYLGEEYDPDTASYVERYGRKMDAVLSLDAYCPREEGETACQALLEQAHDALTAVGAMASGLKAGEMTWQEGGWEEKTGSYHRRGELAMSAYFIAVVQEETGLLLDFILKGVPIL